MRGGCYSGMWDGGGKVMSHTCVLLHTNSLNEFSSSMARRKILIM